jgi:hypothetical protein
MVLINKQTLNFCGMPHKQFKQITLEKPQVAKNIQLENVILSPVAGHHFVHHLAEVKKPFT